MNIKSLRRLSLLLDVSEETLISVSNKAGHYYSPFISYPKAQPFAIQPVSSKRRSIDNPVNPLKAIQKAIYKRLLISLPWPEHIVGGIAGKSILTNVARHLSSELIVTLDIKQFFPHVTNKHVYDVWSNLLGCAPPVAGLLTRLTTFERHLPQGASTSSALANLVLFTVDQDIRNFCYENDIEYSTFIDDLAFSGSQARKVINIAVEALRRAGFAVSHHKSKIMANYTRQVLTNIVINRQPGILKPYLSNTRSGIRKLETGMIAVGLIPRYVERLRGRISYINIINPQRAQPLRRDLDRALEL